MDFHGEIMTQIWENALIVPDTYFIGYNLNKNLTGNETC